MGNDYSFSSSSQQRKTENIQHSNFQNNFHLSFIKCLLSGLVHLSSIFFLTTKRRFADSSKNVVCCSVAFSNSAFSPESGVSQLEKHWVNLQAQTMKHRLKSSVLVSRRLWRDEHYCFDANNFHFKPGKITLNWVLKLNHNCLAMPERD